MVKHKSFVYKATETAIMIAALTIQGYFGLFSGARTFRKWLKAASHNVKVKVKDRRGY